MQFHLGFQPSISFNKITHQDELLLIGSCFSEHIGDRLKDLKFNVYTNPFGIIFNPESIATSIKRIINKDYFKAHEVFEKEEFWYSLETHSSVFGKTQDDLINQLNQLIDEWHLKLKSAHWLTITFGTAFCYKHIEQNHIVANCHKLPQALFEKQLLQTVDIVNEYNLLLDQLKQFNADLKIVLTVSPVKHLRDGVVENSLSKAILIQSVHQIIKQNTNCSYFPSYELVNDDLRDYRFYESDMAHPNKQAIEYVWKRFSEAYFNDATKLINDKLIHIHQAYHHRLINETTGSSVKFKHKFYQQCVVLQAQYTYLNLSKELNYFNTYED